MPLLPGVDPRLETTPEGKARARKMGTALIKALFGNRFGTNPHFFGIKEGLQNFNGFIHDDRGARRLFLSFLRFGQGEIPTEEHQAQILMNVNALANAGFPTPRFEVGKDSKLLMKVPNQVEIDGEMVDVPSHIRGGWAVAQEYVAQAHGVPNPIQTIEQARNMGRLMGLYHQKGAAAFNDIGTMENPVSLERLEKMVKACFDFNPDRPALEIITGLSVSGSEDTHNIRATIAAFGRKIEAEEKILAKLDDGNPEKTRRQKSLGLVKELADLLERDDWARKTLNDYLDAEIIWKQLRFDNLPDARNHGDFHSGNMFASDEKHPNGIMYDMGWMGDGKRLFDMCQALAISCHKDGKFWPEAAKAFVAGVQEQIRLTDKEIKAFPQMLNIVYLRSIATRFVSMVASPETQFVLKSPVELQERRKAYQEEVLATGKNWAKGEFPEQARPGAAAQGAGEVGGEDRGAAHGTP